MEGNVYLQSVVYSLVQRIAGQPVGQTSGDEVYDRMNIYYEHMSIQLYLILWWCGDFFISLNKYLNSVIVMTMILLIFCFPQLFLTLPLAYHPQSTNYSITFFIHCDDILNKRLILKLASHAARLIINWWWYFFITCTKKKLKCIVKKNYIYDNRLQGNYNIN